MNLIKVVSFVVLVSFVFAKTEKVDNSAQIELLKKEIATIDGKLKDNIWVIKYNNYKTYKVIAKELDELENRLYWLQHQRATSHIKNEIQKTSKLLSSKKSELKILEEYKNHPFGDLTELHKLKEEPVVSNPFDILGAFSYIKSIDETKNTLNKNLKHLEDAISLMYSKKELEIKLADIDNSYQSDKSNDIFDFEATKSAYSTSILVYEKKFEDTKNGLTLKIKEQFSKLITMAIILMMFFLISLFVKFLARKYIEDSERFYVTKKMISITTYTLMILVVIFMYIENAGHLVTFLGFAGAGITIAMKDWFMNILGWVVMITGGSVRVGDRIKATMGMESFVGDVVDISLLRITIYEDVTLNSYQNHKRAGRIVFIPNNYIFTNLLSNYSHNGIKTVWDEVEIVISFDSNHKKALGICRDIVKKYSKNFSDSTKTQLVKLRDKYSLKAINVEPRVFNFIGEYGMVISVWFLTNSYATLTLKSSISSEIVDAFNNESDIKIAYPTQVVSLSKN